MGIKINYLGAISSENAQNPKTPKPQNLYCKLRGFIEINKKNFFEYFSCITKLLNRKNKKIIFDMLSFTWTQKKNVEKKSEKS